MEKSQPVFGWKEAKQHKATNPPFIRKLDATAFQDHPANMSPSQSSPPVVKYQTTSHFTFIPASA